MLRGKRAEREDRLPLAALIAPSSSFKVMHCEVSLTTPSERAAVQNPDRDTRRLVILAALDFEGESAERALGYPRQSVEPLRPFSSRTSSWRSS
jgi:hypothetical protein